MMKKIQRDLCLKNYPEFPLRWYVEEEDEEYFFYPEVIPGSWICLPDKNSLSTRELAKELTKLFALADVKSLTFLGDTEQSWITNLTLERNDYQPLTDAVNYFSQWGVDSKFNGGIEVTTESLNSFLIHFYTLVRCDASLPYFHFIDGEHQILGTIHYSGDVRLDTFTKQACSLIEGLISKSNFKG